MRSPRGRRAKSERLLARLGVLRCATCGARMVIGSTDQNGKRHYMYRCPPIGDCPRRVTISADLAEQAVVDDGARAARRASRAARASTDGVAEAERELGRRERRARRGRPRVHRARGRDAAREQLLELRDARDDARERARRATAPRRRRR